MDCTACQGTIPDDAKFCTECGVPQMLACAACGHTNPPGAKFCTACGTALGASTPAKDPPAEAERRDQRHSDGGSGDTTRIIGQRDDRAGSE